MWEKIKEFKLMLGLVAVIGPLMYSSGLWVAANVVFAAEFNKYKIQDELRWMNYDEQRLRSEYYNLRNLRKMTTRDKQRLVTVEGELDHTAASRLALEKELRAVPVMVGR